MYVIVNPLSMVVCMLSAYKLGIIFLLPYEEESYFPEVSSYYHVSRKIFN
jgi:uncharacterized protein (DUF2062 family)